MTYDNHIPAIETSEEANTIDVAIAAVRAWRERYPVDQIHLGAEAYEYLLHCIAGAVADGRDAERTNAVRIAREMKQPAVAERIATQASPYRPSPSDQQANEP